MINHILQGIGIGIGLFITLVVIGLIMLVIYKIISNKYDASELLEPFEIYKNKILNEEKYEEVTMLDDIIHYLKLDKLHVNIKKYEIEELESNNNGFISINIEDKEEETENLLLNKNVKGTQDSDIKYIIKGLKR